MKYHLLPERRTLMQSPRTKPRKSTVGTLYAVGGMDNNKGIRLLFFSLNRICFAAVTIFCLMANNEIIFYSKVFGVKSNQK
ncbi:E3 ubiquitin-protein ligase RNF185 [Platysternon megacephalum]|uniref:E3 ubiquitin-protein ligase RNF185 n=1 Tax=Platysternon megacephalum TaxID=55544 RepID=A0A4D9DZV0_9SAUR|nr:E3 ubiquitin-protein ligase RNF185 [Platysternon megacephalum]